MQAYIPDSLLLNNIYIPFYVSPVKKIYTGENGLTFETDINGIKSIINLSNCIPFIDTSRIDPETKDWFWYTSDGFPFRIERHANGGDWQLSSIYNIGTYRNCKLVFNPNSLIYDSYGKELGFYSNVITVIDQNQNESNPEQLRVYNGKQLFLEIGGEILKDQTSYYNFQSNITLTNLNTNLNKEFYYDINLNKIYTNQNLAAYDLSKIRLHSYSMINSATIKCRLKSNFGTHNYATPMVDYYIAKLHGQLLKG